MNILIATYPFGLCGDQPVKLLEETGWNIKYNSLGRRLKGDEVKDLLKDVDGVIAGTEPYNKEYEVLEDIAQQIKSLQTEYDDYEKQCNMMDVLKG